MTTKDISFTGAANSNLSLIVLLIVILSFILVSLWNDTINKIYYDMLGFDRTSTLHSLLLSFTITFIVITMIYCIKKTT